MILKPITAKNVRNLCEESNEMTRPRNARAIFDPKRDSLGPHKKPGVRIRCGILALLGLTLWQCSSQPQTNTAPPSAVGNRYLLIFETSRSMQRRSEGALKAVQQLLVSGMGGQLRRGDSLGIWTYDEELHAGAFPVQPLSPETQRSTVGRALTFLKQQSYEKKANLPAVMPALQRLIKDSPLLTIILVSDGEQKIYGTQFDQQVNENFSRWQNQQQDARMPFLTVLRSKAGVLTDFSVNPAPWPVEMPPLPKDLAVVDNIKKQAPAQTNKPPPPMAPPLFISGKKTTSIGTSNVVAAAGTNAPVNPERNQAPLFVGSPSTNESTPNLAERTTATNASPTTLSVTTATAVSSSVQTNSTTISAQKLAPTTAALSTPQTTQSPVSLLETSATNAPSETETGNTATPQNAKVGTAAPAAPVVAVTPERFFIRDWRWAIVGTLLLGLCVWLSLRGRRGSRASRDASLITRSLDRERP